MKKSLTVYMVSVKYREGMRDDEVLWNLAQSYGSCGFGTAWCGSSDFASFAQVMPDIEFSFLSDNPASTVYRFAESAVNLDDLVEEVRIAKTKV